MVVEAELPNQVTIDILAPCIEYFNNIITKEEADFIINTCEESNNDVEHPWKFDYAKIGNAKEINNNVRSNKLMPLQKLMLVEGKHENAKKVLNILNQKVYSAVKYYTNKHDFQIATDEGFIILKYQTGNEYKPHIDAGIGRPYCDRTLSMVAYLNPTEYNGGDTYFNNFNVSVKPQNIGLVLFPSNYAYVHQARPVETGTKYAVVTWLSMPKKIQ